MMLLKSRIEIIANDKVIPICLRSVLRGSERNRFGKIFFKYEKRDENSVLLREGRIGSPIMKLVPCPSFGPGVDAAFGDLRRDIEKITAISSGVDEELDRWRLEISRNPSRAVESFALEISPEERRIEIEASDDLGAIYGIYEFSHQFLGIDPLWFWKEMEPLPLVSFSPESQRIESGLPEFRFRGLFVNDEDLLGRWRPSSGERFQDWPKRESVLSQSSTLLKDNYEARLLGYYTPVVESEAMEMIFEAILRLRGNLVIPASFIDVFNGAEAAVIRAAVQRGLYVSQHHVEPLGVSHFGYETWWSRQGQNPQFSYLSDPDSMRAAWRAYAEEWYRLAGNQVIWQLGLRGRGDRPLWDHDPAAAARAAELFRKAFDDQMEIIRKVDSRETPPVTVTLWFEVSRLIQDGDLRLPSNVIRVFADDDKTLEMKGDFHRTDRGGDLPFGCYVHLAVWGAGPHLVQGVSPDRIVRIANEIVGKGDTAYAIVNAANLREHVVGLGCWFEQLWRTRREAFENSLQDFVPEGAARYYREFFEVIPEFKTGWRLYDGRASGWILQLIRMHSSGEPLSADLQKEVVGDWRDAIGCILDESIARQNQLLDSMEDEKLTWKSRDRRFLEFNLITQLRILRGMCKCIRELSRETPDFPLARGALVEALKAMSESERGRWVNWYRGDLKVGVKALLKHLEDLESQRA